jgi:hypothetical protein
MSEDEDANMLAHLKKMGEKQVRLLLSNGGMPLPFHPVAFKWLTDIDQELERVREASKAEQIEIARSAKDAAWAAARAAERAAKAAEKANIRATIALIIAAISIAATIIGIWLVHLDATRTTSRSAYFSAARASSADSLSRPLLSYA